MSDDTPDFAAVIISAIEAALGDLHVGLPAKVVAFDAATARADVQPLLKATHFDEDDVLVTADLPVIPDVPFLYFAMGGWIISAAPDVGDIVYLTFAERSLDAWSNAPAGDTVDPVDPRKHALTDAVAVGGIRPAGSPVPVDGTALWIGREDGSARIELGRDGSIVVKGASVKLGSASATEAAVHGALLVQVLNQIMAAFGSLTAPSGGPAVGPALIAATSALMAQLLSTKVKVD